MRKNTRIFTKTNTLSITEPRKIWIMLASSKENGEKALLVYILGCTCISANQHNKSLLSSSFLCCVYNKNISLVFTATVYNKNTSLVSTAAVVITGIFFSYPQPLCIYKNTSLVNRAGKQSRCVYKKIFLVYTQPVYITIIFLLYTQPLCI